MKKSGRLIYNSSILMAIAGIMLFCSFHSKIGAVITHKRRFQSPVRIAAGPGGNLLVSDYKAKVIFTVGKNSGRIIKGFKIRGNPLGVAYHKNKIYVGNKTHRKIEVYTTSGIKRSSFPRIIKQPNDIVIDGAGNRLYVTDTLRRNVKVFNLDGEFLFKIDQNLIAPTGITIDQNNGILYVSDYGDPNGWVRPSIQAYNLDGSPAGSISSKKGMFGARFSKPQGLAVDDNGYIFLVDNYSAEVLVFSGLSGNLLKTLGGFGTGPGKMQLPYDIVISSSKDLFVTNYLKKKIEIFRNGGNI